MFPEWRLPSVLVRMPGGSLQIGIAHDFAVTMTGPVEPVFRGVCLLPMA